MTLTDLQNNLAGLLYRFGDHQNASKALERLIGPQAIDEKITKKSLFQLAIILEAMGKLDLARYRYKQFLEQYPNSDKIKIVQGKLTQISREGKTK